MNPLDARCNISRNDAICVSQLKNAKHIDPAILQERPDVKIFLPFRFFVYRPEMLFQPNTYNRYLGKIPSYASLYLFIYNYLFTEESSKFLCECVQD